MSEFKDLEGLLRLKRYEQPPEGYYEEFIESFKERQRSEMLSQSARGLFIERVSTYFWGFGPRHWAMAGGAFCVLVAGGFLVFPGSEAAADSAAGAGTNETEISTPASSAKVLPAPTEPDSKRDEAPSDTP